VMVVRRQLESLLGQANGNPGKEHLLAALAYSEIRTRDGQAASSHLSQLLQEFPKTEYGDMARAAQLEAEITAASPQGSPPNAEALKTAMGKADQLAREAQAPDAQAYATYVKAGAQEQTGQIDEAIASFLEVAQKYPNAAHAALSLMRAGRAQQKTGKPEQAVTTYEQLLARYPSDDASKEARKVMRELRIIGKAAPELKVEDWVSGEPSSIASLKGKVVLVNFWQTWCPHCRKELPHMGELYNKYKDQGLVVIGATKNDNRQNEEQLKEFLDQNPVPYPIARVDPSSSNDYAVSGIPAAALIDRDGIVRWRAHPGQLSETQLEQFLAQK